MRSAGSVRRVAIIGLGLALVLGACSDDDASPDRDPSTTLGASSTTRPVTTTSAPTSGPSVSSTTAAPVEGQVDWTVLVYLMGDTDLEGFALTDVLEMASVGSTDRVNIVALVDRHPEYSDDGVLNLPDWEDTKLLGIGRGELIEYGESSELNLGSPETFASFIEVGLTNFPASHYALILWDHGAGWPGVGPDETNGLDVLDMADLAQGLENGLAAAGVDSIDLIGFDACLMSTYEVASVVAPYADFMLASQELVPGHGWDYESLGLLAQDPGSSPQELGSAFVEGFAGQAQAMGTGADITLSLLDLNGIETFQSAFGTLAQLIATSPSVYGQALASARRDLLGFGRNPDPDLDTNLVDLGGLLANLGERADLGDLASAARDASVALESLVVTKVNGPATTGASGLSVYFPEIERYFRQGYLFLQGVPAWPDALAGFYQAGAAIPEDEQPAFVDDADGAIVFFDGDGLNVFGPLEQIAIDSVIDASIFYGVVEESDVQVLFGEEPAEVFEVDGVPGVGAIYDLTYLQLDDGEDSALAYLSLAIDPDSGLLLIDIPLWYRAPFADEPEDVILSLVVDPTNAAVLEEDFYTVDASGTYGSLSADPEGLIFPLVLVVQPDGSSEWLPTTEVGLWADLPLIQYDFIPLDSGTQLYVDLTVWDFGGNADSIVLYPVIP